MSIDELIEVGRRELPDHLATSPGSIIGDLLRAVAAMIAAAQKQEDGDDDTR